METCTKSTDTPRVNRRQPLVMGFALVVVVAALAVPWTLVGTTAAYAAGCPSVEFIGVRGSGEHAGFGGTVGSVLSYVNAHGSAVGNRTIDYWAVNVNPWEPAYFPDYMSSVKQGVTNLGNAVTAFRKSCSGTPILLAGYSQGAEVIDHWLSSGSSLKDIAGVTLLGDPRFSPANGTTIDQGNYNRKLYGVSYTFFPHLGIFGGVEHYPSDRGTWLRSYCANHDPICNTSSLAALVGCGIGSCAHNHYPDMTIEPGVTYTEAAGRFLISRWQAVSKPAQPASPSDPDSTPAASPEPAAGTGSGSTMSPPAAAYAETSGSVVHTWTDYADAGGSEGPSIPSNDTVQIACKVSGFEVQDGDTWWYLVASSPWNSAYYASADAFYNNGQTSGSLIGTPFVDPNVPNCPGASEAPSETEPPQQGTFAETSGSVVHTWTDYADAGGSEGPSIPSNDTVQIACKVSGFEVQDGDTWWYLVASSPWNSAYYASADAFYNNGQTSGSLIGTPFVDPNVPNC